MNTMIMQDDRIQHESYYSKDDSVHDLIDVLFAKSLEEKK